MRGLKQVQWVRIAGVNAVLREYQESAGNGKQKDSVRKVIVVVFGTMRISVHNRHQCPLLPLNHRQKNMVKANSRGRSPGGRSPSGKLARRPCREYIKGKCTRPSCEILESS